MTARVTRIRLNDAGFRQLLRSPAVLGDLTARGRRIAAAGGPGMEVDPDVGTVRARVTVRTATRQAREAEATDRALTRAVDAGRG